MPAPTSRAHCGPSLAYFFLLFALACVSVVSSHSLSPHRTSIHDFVPAAIDAHDQNFELITERGNRLGIEWGKVRNLASDSSSSSSLKDNDNAIIISITPSALQQSGDVVQVCVAQVPGPNALTDFIAAYAPADADLHATAPVKLKYLYEETSHSSSPALYSSTGQGCVSFRLLNLRDAYSFALMRGSLTSPLLLARSAAMEFKEPNEVTQVHLALTGNDGEMTVTWVTRDTEAPVVQWWAAMPEEDGRGKGRRARTIRRQAREGNCQAVEKRWQSLKSAKAESGGTPATSSQPLDHTEHQALATTTTYTRQDMCSPPATTVGFHDPGAIHSALMRGLKGGRDYTYRVGDAALNVWSGCITFTAPPFFPSQEEGEGIEVGRADVTYTFAVFGDMGTAEEDGSTNMGKGEIASLSTTRLLLQALSSSSSLSLSRPPLSLVLHIGDLSYSWGYDYQWDEFLTQNEKIMKVVPWMVSSGNHEREASAVSRFHQSPSLYIGEDSGGECGVPTQLRFPMPGPWQEAEKDEPWYSFTSGPVHWVVLCIEKEFMPGSPQHDFLLDILSSQVNRTLTPWLVVAAHRPMYLDSSDDPDEEDSDQFVARKMQEGLEDVLMHHKVDLALYGHHHSYQRTCQVYQNECLAPSTGAEYKAPVHAVVGMAGKVLHENALAIRPAIFEHVDMSHFGLTLMTVNRTHLTLTLYSDEEGGEVLDTFTLLVKGGGEGG